MKFGLINIDDADGVILAHSMRIGDLRLPKGMVISQTQIAALRDAGINQIRATHMDDDKVDENIVAVGVGCLLKETPQRIQPRSKTQTANGPKVGLLLAAGASSRMLGDDKLLREIDGVALLRRSAQSMLNANIDQVFVSIRSNSPAHKNALADLPVTIVEVTDAAAGMSASIRAGVAAIPNDTSMIVLGLADMPDITAQHYNLIIGAHNAAQNRLIIRPVTPAGKRGNPVLFDARFTENLYTIEGDQGARDILKSVPEFIHHVQMNNDAVAIDLDTPAAWNRWLLSKQEI
jgi:molybdenum cofactor cytidylyltransferase